VNIDRLEQGKLFHMPKSTGFPEEVNGRLKIQSFALKKKRGP